MPSAPEPAAPASLAPVAPLRLGDRVRVIAPASPADPDELERGLAWLAGRYHVEVGAALRARRGYLAGDDQARLADLEDALDDAEARAIVCARGGYGVTRLLDRVDPARVRGRPKLLVGFSDITALHVLWARAGLRSLHATMVAGLGRASEPEREGWAAACAGAPPPPLTGLTALCPGVAEGPLLGGNLALLCALLGTPYAPALEGAIVFLEDVGEAPYRLDRMLTQLRHAGLRRAAAVVIGQLTRCGPADGREVAALLEDRLGDLGVPVARGVPSGHEPDNRPLPLGAPARLDAAAGRLSWPHGGAVRADPSVAAG